MRQPPDPHGDPDVHHLSRDVAERQVAHHLLLSDPCVHQAHVAAGGERGPCELGGGERKRLIRWVLIVLCVTGHMFLSVQKQKVNVQYVATVF